MNNKINDNLFYTKTFFDDILWRIKHEIEISEAYPIYSKFALSEKEIEYYKGRIDAAKGILNFINNYDELVIHPENKFRDLGDLMKDAGFK